MNRRIIAVTAVMGLLVAFSAGELFAAGKGNGGGGKGNGSAACNNQGGSAATTRPAGSQRRDGTFLTTGTTANGSTTRPGNGNGLQDGSHLTTTAVQPATATP